MLKNHREIRDQLESLGVSSLFEDTKKHTRIMISYCGESLVYHCSSSPSDCRAIRNIVGDVKRWVRAIHVDKGLSKGA